MPVERRQDLFLEQPRQARGPRPVDQPFGKGREQFAAITEFGEHDLARLDGERAASIARSEERRVGKEGVSTCRSRWTPYHEKEHDAQINTLTLVHTSHYTVSLICPNQTRSALYTRVYLDNTINQ